MPFYILKIDTGSVHNSTNSPNVLLFSTYEKASQHSNDLITMLRISKYNMKIIEVELDKTTYSHGGLYEGVF